MSRAHLVALGLVIVVALGCQKEPPASAERPPSTTATATADQPAPSAEVVETLRRISHYKFWKVDDIRIDPEKIVSLQGQFDGNTWPRFKVLRLEHLGNPATKWHTGEPFKPVEGDPHLTAYAVRPSDPDSGQPTERDVDVLNQFTRFQRRKWRIGALEILLVPSGKGVNVDNVARPQQGQHYGCYAVKDAGPQPLNPPIHVQDQFDLLMDGRRERFTTVTPKYLCVPVLKHHEGPPPTSYWRKEPHLALYEIGLDQARTWNVVINDQFLQRRVVPRHTSWLGVPTMKYWTAPQPTQ